MTTADELRQRQAELDAAQLELGRITADAAKAQTSYDALCAQRVEGRPHFYADEAHATLATLNAQVGRQRDLVRDLAAEVRQLDRLANAPVRLEQARQQLRDTRAATVAAVGRRQPHVDRIGKLQDQHAAEGAAAAASRAWAQEQLLARIEQREPAAGERPTYSPEQHEATKALIDSMIDNEQKAIVALDVEIASLRAAEAAAGQAVLEAAAAVREAEAAEAMTAFTAIWTRYAAAHEAAHGSRPAAPDFGNDRAAYKAALDEARQVLDAEPEGAIKRAMRKVAAAIGA